MGIQKWKNQECHDGIPVHIMVAMVPGQVKEPLHWPSQETRHRYTNNQYAHRTCTYHVC